MTFCYPSFLEKGAVSEGEEQESGFIISKNPNIFQYVIYLFYCFG
jgi:hypothetical protein